MQLNVLAIGDVVGTPGLEFLQQKLRAARRNFHVDFCIVNGENASMNGISARQAEAILDAGADVITLGNHTFGNRSICDTLDDSPYVLRPANYAPQLPGRGWGIYETSAGPLAVINLIGRCNMDFAPDNPFLQIDRILQKAATKLTVLDFHAEATSEKLAMGYLLDGRVSAVYGTHTHVPTADCRILPKGTGYRTDIGMTGPWQSVLGIRPEQSIAKFRGDLTARYEAADGPCVMQGTLFTLDARTGHCVEIQPIEIF